MSFREKHLWVAIIAGLAVWGAYGWKFFERVLAGGLKQADFAADMGRDAEADADPHGPQHQVLSQQAVGRSQP